MKIVSFLTGIVLLCQPAFAQKNSDKQKLIASIESQQATYTDIAKKIWGFAELGYQEKQSTALLQEQLVKAGFQVTPGVAEIPTAFVASFGSGSPVVGILAEFDALPGMSQAALPEVKAIHDGEPGHACGHNLLGTGAMAAAVAVKDWMKTAGIKGTIRLYGTPAEEGGAGKAYMVRAGLFKDVDVVLHWHPGAVNDASPSSTFANKSAKFRFRGIAAHASGAPERGRSALDGVEAMDYMVNMMREHIPSNTRIHYVITKGGEAPNVVPAFAEVFYYVRHPEVKMVKEIWERIVKAAEGAATGTGTKMDYEVIHGAYNILPNETLARVMHSNLLAVGGVTYTEEEKSFGAKIQTSFDTKPPLESAKEVVNFQPGKVTTSSTDVGDVSGMFLRADSLLPRMYPVPLVIPGR